MSALPASWRDQREPIDTGLLWSALALLGLGLVMVYSASIVAAEADRHTGYHSYYYLMRQAASLAMALLLGYLAFRIPEHTWQNLALPFFVISLLGLVLVLVPGVGREVNGSRRWLSLVVLTVQPSEFMKLAATLYAADYTVRKAALMHSLRKGFMPMAMAMLLVGSLLLREPDFGAFAVITVITMAILFMGGLNWRLFVVLVLILLVGFAALVVMSPYRLQRVIWFLDPWKDPFGKGYQLTHALIAFGRGQLFGVGLGASVEKQLYLPEAHTDFLLAVIAEELGLVGVCVTVALFAWLVWRIFRIGQRAAAMERYFAALTAQGVGVWLAVQACVNMGVNMGLLPTKGLTLPLLSYGGSGILTNCVALAIVARIDYESRHLSGGRRT
ncbi:MAG: putative lipid II flippase FtsW [Pseudomonadota bacterium]|nr:putative lipid II flippase FtsW [Pseudomonadota bacterium]